MIKERLKKESNSDRDRTGFYFCRQQIVIADRAVLKSLSELILRLRLLHILIG